MPRLLKSAKLVSTTANLDEARSPIFSFRKWSEVMRMRWTTLNEATDADGFLLEGEECFAAELRVLVAAGYPDVQSAKFISLDVTGRNESAMTADVSEETARCFEKELEAERQET